MAAIAEVGAMNVCKVVQEKQPAIIYFGVFFDGTFNHRLQVLIGKNYRSAHNYELQQKKENLERNIQQLTYDINHPNTDLDTLNRKVLSVNQFKKELAAVEKTLQNTITGDECEIIKDFTHDTGSDKDKGINQKVYNVNNNTESEEEKRRSNLSDLNKKVDKLYDNYIIQNNDFTNIAILETFYRAKQNLTTDEYAYRIYVSGSGTDRDLQKKENFNGGGFGQGSTGVIQKVIDAICCINNKLTLFSNASSIELVFHVFGFSRGATESRMFAHVLNVLKNETGTKEFDYWHKKLKQKINIVDNGRLNNRIKSISIPKMGIYDTVSSVGILDKDKVLSLNTIGEIVETFSVTKSEQHHRNINDLGLNDLKMVEKVYHICALDEYRENFALVPINDSTARIKKQIYIPGCHADVGGGNVAGYDKLIKFPEGDFYMPQEAIPYHKRQNNNDWIDQSKMFLFTKGDLKNVGWLDEQKDIIDNIPNTVSIRRYSKKGYSYVGLRLMVNEFNDIFDFDDNKFCLKDKILQTIYDNATTLENDGCYYPDEDTYKALRNNYLFISMDNSLLPVSKPNFISITKNDEVRKCLSRIEYTDEYCLEVEQKKHEFNIKAYTNTINYA